MLASYVGQRDVVFHTGLDDPIAFQCLCPLVGRQRRQRRGVLRLPVHYTLFYDRLPLPELCREYIYLGKDVQARRRDFKGLAYATAARPAFIFGKVASWRSPCTAEEEETQPLRA